MIANSQQLQSTLQRISTCESQAAERRKTERRKAQPDWKRYLAAGSEFSTELKGLRQEVHDYFSAFRASRGPALELHDAIDLVREALPASQADLVVEHLLPSARIVVHYETDSVTDTTSSHFGGVPLMPRGMDWPMWDRTKFLTEEIKRSETRFQANPQATGPRDYALRKRQELSQPIVPLLFLGQFYLAEIHAVAPLPDWPAEGSLAFFYEPSGVDCDPLCQGYCRVLHFPDGEPLVPLPHHAGLSEKARFPHRRLSFAKEWALPSWIDVDLSAWGLENEIYNELCNGLMPVASEQEPIHRCGGHPQVIQAIDMRSTCQHVWNALSNGDMSNDSASRRDVLENHADDWHLLVQIDSDEKRLGWMWGDVGRVYFWARWQDIQAKQFEHSWATEQSY
jgi:uncharacterized protein YwqG